jgi:hypothetical protein
MRDCDFLPFTQPQPTPNPPNASFIGLPNQLSFGLEKYQSKFLISGLYRAGNISVYNSADTLIGSPNALAPASVKVYPGGARQAGFVDSYVLSFDGDLNYNTLLVSQTTFASSSIYPIKSYIDDEKIMTLWYAQNPGTVNFYGSAGPAVSSNIGLAGYNGYLTMANGWNTQSYADVYTMYCDNNDYVFPLSNKYNSVSKTLYLAGTYGQTSTTGNSMYITNGSTGTTLPPQEKLDVFLAKFDVSSSTPTNLWSARIASTQDDLQGLAPYLSTTGINVDSRDNVYFTNRYTQGAAGFYPAGATAGTAPSYVCTEALSGGSIAAAFFARYGKNGV